MTDPEPVELPDPLATFARAIVALLLAARCEPRGLEGQTVWTASW